MTSHSFH